VLRHSDARVILQRQLALALQGCVALLAPGQRLGMALSQFTAPGLLLRASDLLVGPLDKFG